MARETVRVNLRLSPEAAEALSRMAPSDWKRGEFVSGLILAAAQEQSSEEATYAAIGRQVLGLALELAKSLPATLPPERAPDRAGADVNPGGNGGQVRQTD